MKDYSNTDQDRREESSLVCQEGTVVRVEDDKAYVKIDSNKQCESCGSKGHCAALFDIENVLEIRNNSGLSAGQRVEIGLRPSAILTASIILFVIPSVLFVLGVIAGYLLGDYYQWESKQWIGFFIGTLLFVFTFFIIRLYSSQMEKSGKYEPIITRVIKQAQGDK